MKKRSHIKASKRLKGRISPYRRLEEELKNAREALRNSVDQYIDCRCALTAVLMYLDNPPSNWTHDDSVRLERIRKLASSC